MSRKTPDHVPQSRIDLEKMLRFSRWLLAEDAMKENRSVDLPSNREVDGRSAA